MIRLGNLEAKCGIYGILCRSNGKWYIGQTYNLDQRKRYHFARLKNNAHHNDHLQAAFNMYGKDQFVFIVLDELPRSQLDERERWWIAHCNSYSRAFGYNKESGGRAYKEVSDETRRKLSHRMLTRKMSAHHIEAIRLAGEKRRGIPNGRLGSVMSAESRLKMSLAKRGKPAKNKGVKYPAYVRQKMSLAHAGKPRPWRIGLKHSEEAKHKMSESAFRRRARERDEACQLN